MIIIIINKYQNYILFSTLFILFYSVLVIIFMLRGNKVSKKKGKNNDNYHWIRIYTCHLAYDTKTYIYAVALSRSCNLQLNGSRSPFIRILFYFTLQEKIVLNQTKLLFLVWTGLILFSFFYDGWNIF